MVVPATSQRGFFALLYPTFFILCFLLCLSCFAVRFVLPQAWQQGLKQSKEPRWQIAIAGALASLYFWIGYLIVRFPGYVDTVEPMVAVASFASVHGRSVYDMAISYGPLCFLPYGLAMKLFGSTLGVLKGVVVVANALFVMLLLLVSRKLLPWPSALVLTTLVLSACLMKQHYLFQSRGDLFIYVAVALGLLSTLTEGSVVAGALMVAALTLGCGVKITAILYFLYPLSLLAKKQGAKTLIVSAGLAALLSFSPFALRTFVLSDYLHWLSVMSHQPKNIKEFVGNVVTSGFLAAPCLLAFWQLHRRDRNQADRYLHNNWFPLALLICSIVLMDGLASKVGAGRHHLNPYFVIVAVISAQLILTAASSDSRPWCPEVLPVCLWGCLALLLLMTELSELEDVRALTALETSQAIELDDDVSSILRSFAGHKVELGNGFGEFDLDRAYSPMFSAAQLVFAGGSYTFDPSAQADIEMVHEPMRESDLRHVASCESDVWLIPHGQAPFHSISIYSGMYPNRYDGRLLYPASFEHLFLETYSLSSSTRFFDIYICKHPT